MLRNGSYSRKGSSRGWRVRKHTRCRVRVIRLAGQTEGRERVAWMWCGDNQNIPICVRSGVSPALGVRREEAASSSDAY